MIPVTKSVIDAAIAFTDKNLNDKAREYFHYRGWDDSVISKWHLGYFPKGKNSELFSEVLKLKFKKNDLKDLRIMNSRFETYFFKRVIFPIQDVHGNFIAITGRVIKKDGEEWDKHKEGPKYYNSAYDKGKHLFGLNFALEEIRRLNIVYVFEGNADVITAHRLGVMNAVGCQGTAFTKEHFALLSRYTKNIVLVFDNDSGGTTAIGRFNKRSGELKSKDISSILGVKNIEVRTLIARLRGHKMDPDKFLLTYGKEKFIETIKAQILDASLQRQYKRIMPPKVVNQYAKKRDV